MMTVVDDKKAVIKRQPMRSSIACLRCRKSKIKCDNDGGSSPCETCIKQGKDCKYPEATPMPPKRSEPPNASKAERDAGSDRKRIKKADDASKAGGQYSAAAHADEILSAHYLTPKLWSEVFDIYRLHFATELPFLHMPTIKENMVPKFKASHQGTSPDTNLVLLGVLTLTARFHPDLVKYATHTASSQAGASRNRPIQPKPDASAASEFFAEALRKALGPLGTTMTTASVERVQAFLMLGLYEWSQVQPKTGGLGAWMYVGVAIRMAQALRLGLGDQVDSRSRPRTNMSRVGSPVVTPSQPELTIGKEIKRRTMFSCLILDRLLACGKERVSTIRSEDLQIQLPCNEWAFDLSKEVKTGFLNGPPDKVPNGAVDDSVLSRFVRLVDLWGEISKFSFAGGRLVEKYPPWDSRTKFYQLRERLEAFYSDLPSTFTLSTSNYHRHENHQASSVYVSLHMLGSVCQIMLHREYIPFLPIRCNRPVGPLDEPTFSPSEYDIPQGFWDVSAEHVFKAARDIVDLIEICREKLPMSALVLFTVWTAAYVGQYAWHFPHMDQQRHLLVDIDGDDRGSETELDMSKVGPTGICYETLGRFSGWLKMASTYLGYFKDLDDYMTKVKNEYYEHVHGSGSKVKAARKDDGKHPISGGGLEEWKIQNAKIMNNGMIMAEEDRHGGYDGSDRSRASTIDHGSPSTGPDSLHTGKTPRSTPSMFVAINSMPAPPGHYDSPHSGHSGPSPRTDGLPGAGPLPGRPPSQPIHPSPVQAHHALPTAGGDPGMMPEDDFMDLLQSGESMRIAEALEGLGGGDIQGFSYGDVMENDMLFGHTLPMMPFGGMGEGVPLRAETPYRPNGPRDDSQTKGGRRDVIANLSAFPI